MSGPSLFLQCKSLVREDIWSGILITEGMKKSHLFFFSKKKLRFVFEDEGWREKKVNEGLVDDSEEDSQYLIDLFFTLIDFDDI